MRIACSERSVCCVVVMALLCILFTCSQSAAATGPPHILNYQGTLTDDQGNPVNGQKTMSFRIYNSATAAPNQALWVSGDVVVPVVKGVFSVNLGEAPQTSIPLNVFSVNTRFLGVTVDGSELPDRKRLVSVPYALNAATAENATNAVNAVNAINAVNAGIPESGWITANETWTYASPTTFTIPGDKTGRYQKGDKIKLNQAAIKYFYIIGVAYADPNTTITITGG